jgi:hypothetical protein
MVITAQLGSLCHAANAIRVLYCRGFLAASNKKTPSATKKRDEHGFALFIAHFDQPFAVLVVNQQDVGRVGQRKLATCGRFAESALSRVNKSGATARAAEDSILPHKNSHYEERHDPNRDRDRDRRYKSLQSG